MSVGDQDYLDGAIITTNVTSSSWVDSTTLTHNTIWDTPIYYEKKKLIGTWESNELEKSLGAELKKLYELENPKKEGIEMKKLYEVIAVYGEDRRNPLVMKPSIPVVIAENDEEAKLKSGIYDQINAIPDIEMDYLTIICRCVGEVKVKERAKEVKQV